MTAAAAVVAAATGAADLAGGRRHPSPGTGVGGGPWQPAAVPELTLADVGPAVRAAWCLQTCDDADVADWSPVNPARGQCGATALMVHDLLGGELLVAEVRHPDGSRQGHHYWNRLPGGVEVDLTREQFAPDEVLQEPRVVERPPGLPHRCAAQYLRLRASVCAALGVRG